MVKAKRTTAQHKERELMVTQALLLDFTFEHVFLPSPGGAKNNRKARRSGYVLLHRNGEPVRWPSTNGPKYAVPMLFPAVWAAAEYAIKLVKAEQDEANKSRPDA